METRRRLKCLIKLILKIKSYRITMLIEGYEANSQIHSNLLKHSSLRWYASPNTHSILLSISLLHCYRWRYVVWFCCKGSIGNHIFPLVRPLLTSALARLAPNFLWNRAFGSSSDPWFLRLSESPLPSSPSKSYNICHTIFPKILVCF